jgi:hypothetical protein
MHAMPNSYRRNEKVRGKERRKKDRKERQKERVRKRKENKYKKNYKKLTPLQLPAGRMLRKPSR